MKEYGGLYYRCLEHGFRKARFWQKRAYCDLCAVMYQAVTKIKRRTKFAKAKISLYQRAYYEAHRERKIAYAKAYREKRKAA